MQSVPDVHQHTFAVPIPLAIPETQNFDPRFGEQFIPSRVASQMFRQAMLNTVEFHHELRRGAKEVHIDAANRMLPAKLESREAPGAQGPPQLFLLVRLIAAQPAGDGGGIHERNCAVPDGEFKRFKGASSPRPSPPFGMEEREDAAPRAYRCAMRPVLRTPSPRDAGAGRGQGERGNPMTRESRKSASSPRPSPPFGMEEREKAPRLRLPIFFSSFAFNTR